MCNWKQGVQGNITLVWNFIFVFHNSRSSIWVRKSPSLASLRYTINNWMLPWQVNPLKQTVLLVFAIIHIIRTCYCCTTTSSSFSLLYIRQSRDLRHWIKAAAEKCKWHRNCCKWKLEMKEWINKIKILPLLILDSKLPSEALIIDDFNNQSI